MTFLPQDYTVPTSTSNYFKFEQGDNKFRVLSSAVIGWEGWIEKSPKRFRMDEKPTDLREFKDQKLNHFWAFIVWNYKAEKLQILQITQKGIMKTMQAHVADEDWGDPKQYDIVVNREGEDLTTKYEVKMKPKKELDKDIVQKYEEATIDLEKLFDGESPFPEETT